tara:strand:+ start:2140 stop:3111 length:972 start_codon:yes stop_codon:yes gene_type:complete
MIKLDDFKYVICEGGSNKGIMYCGAYKVLCDYTDFREKLSNVKGFIGTSSGAIFALGLSIGFSPSQGMAIAKHMASSLQNVAPQMDIGMLWNSFGTDDGNQMRKIIAGILSEKGFSGDITLSQLQHLCNNTFICVATEIPSQKAVYFNAKDHPDLKVVDAVFMSMCVPFLFRPFKYNNKLYVDGGLRANFPLSYCDAKDAFTFSFNVPEDTEIKDWQGYLYNIITCSVACQDEEKKKYIENSVYKVSLTYPQYLRQYSSLNSHMDENLVKRFYNCGYFQALNVFVGEIIASMEKCLKMVIIVRVNYLYFCLSTECDEHLSTYP